jgi:hypothetical protein
MHFRGFSCVWAIALFFPLVYVAPALSFSKSSRFVPTAKFLASPKPSTPLKPLTTNQSGIRGKVVRLTGDHMPTLVDPALKKIAARGQSQRMQTSVWVFAGRIPGQDPRWAISAAKQHPKLLGQMKTNARGEFTIALPPGEYTLFAQYSSDLYLNSFMGDGNYSTVQVEIGVTTVDLVNSENAVF